jgi:hypothetical protein
MLSLMKRMSHSVLLLKRWGHLISGWFKSLSMPFLLVGVHMLFVSPSISSISMRFSNWSISSAHLMERVHVSSCLAISLISPLLWVRSIMLLISPGTNSVVWGISKALRMSLMMISLLMMSSPSLMVMHLHERFLLLILVKRHFMSVN